MQPGFLFAESPGLPHHVPLLGVLAERLALSNPTELINLGQVAGPGVRPAAGRIGLY
jgi:hypothetical protein